MTIGGGQKPAVRVQVDPVALAGAGLTLEDVRNAIVAANVNQPKGNLDGPRQDWALRPTISSPRPTTFRPLVIAYKNGSPIRLARRRRRDRRRRERAARRLGRRRQRAIIVNVQRQPGANIIDVVDKIKELLPQLEASMPQAIDVNVLADRTETVRASVHDVQFTLVLTILSSIGVIYFFLGSARATIIPGVAVPLSLIGTFGVMKLVGLLPRQPVADGVDDLDRVRRRRRDRDDREHVALHRRGREAVQRRAQGREQIGFTIVSLTVSLVAVLIPLLFMSGLVGRLFREFAITLAIAIGISALLSLTLTAMMSAWILKPHRGGPEPIWIVRELRARGSPRLTRFYDRTLQVVLRHR